MSASNAGPGSAWHTDAPAPTHAHAFQRYYIGPSPVSSSAASKVARAIREDVDVKRPVGWSVVAREGVVLVGAGDADEQGQEEEEEEGDRDEDVSRQRHSPDGSTSPTSPTSHPPAPQSTPATKSTFTSHDLSYSTATPHASANTTTDLYTSRLSSPPSQHPHRSSTPPPKPSSSADNQQLLSPPSARKKIELREIPSIHSLRGNQSEPQQANQSGRQGGLHARFIDSIDENLIHHRQERKNRTVSRDPSADEMIQMGLTPAGTADDTDDRLSSAGLTHDHTRDPTHDPTHDGFTTVTTDGQPSTPRPFNRSMHTRDFSRQSRISRASTAGTFASAATKATDGSFGATGGVRARLARAFPRSKKTKSRTSRSLSTVGSLHHARLSANALAAASAANGNANANGSATHLDARRLRRSWKSGVAPGQVGTSSGGTKWVGQSFEVGARLKYVLDVCEKQRVQSAQQQQQRQQEESTSPKGPPALPKIVTTSIDADTSTHTNTDGSVSPRDTRRRVNRSPSSVLSAFAKDASMAADDKRPNDAGPSRRQTLPTIQAEADEDASTRPIRASPLGNSKSHLSLPSNAPSPNRRTSFVIPSPKRAVSIASLHPEESPAAAPSAGSSSPATAAAPPIESRRGWSDIASLMSAQSSLQASNLHRSIVDRAEHTVKAMRTSRKTLGGPAAQRREHSDSVLAIPETVDTPTQTPALVFKTPMETLSGSQDDYFAGATTAQDDDEEDNKSAPAATQRSPHPATTTPMMTAQEAFTHPDPPQAAEEQFPELTFNLLRRPSDVVDGAPKNTSDDAIAVAPSTVRPSTPPARRPSHVAFNSPRYTIDSANGATTGPVTNVGSSLADSDSPLLQNKPSIGSIVIHQQTQHAADAPPDASYLQRVPPTQPNKKKTVQFEKKNGTLPRGSPMRSLSTSLFPNSALSVPPAGEPRRSGAPFLRSSNSGSPSGDAAPAPPHIVLARQPDDPSPAKEHTPDHETTVEEEFITRKSLLRRDRMLVKNDWTPSENVPQDLDEAQSRGLSIHPGQWREYIVVLRPGRIELWDDPGFADRFFSHTDPLHLAFVIPLARGYTFLSVFSQVDRIFCLTYSQAHASTHVSGGGKQRKVLNLRKSGTNILLFEARTLTIGADWIWDIWREIGSNLPDAVEVHLPYADLRVKFPIPEEMIECDDYEEEELAMIGARSVLDVPRHPDQERGGEGYKMITRPRVVGTILRLLKSVPDYEQVLRSGFSHGSKFELAWRRGSTIEWVVYDRTLDDQMRYWSILFGSILKQTKEPSVLEFRKAQHYPTRVTLGDGQILEEPPGLEGFLWRVRPVSGVLTRIYITTHDSHVFVCRPSRAYPPDRYLAVDADHIKALQASAMQGARDAGGAGAGSGGIDDDRPNRSRTQPAAKGRRASVDGAARRDMKRSATSGTGGRDESSASLLRRRGYQDAISHVSNDAHELAAQMEAYRALEKQRQLDQIANADGYIEVKDIFLIRYLGDDGEAWKPGVHDPVCAPMHMPNAEEENTPNDGDDDDDDEEETTDDEVIDIGGEEGLAHAAPATSTMGATASEHRMHLRRQRQFEVVMANGRTTRFEAYSKSVAKEWVHRIHNLATYWKRREKVDALEKMEVSGFDPSLIRRNKLQDTSPLDRMTTMGRSEIDAASPSLSNIWNWCTILACRGIILCGRLFAKKRAHAPFYSRYYILISGRLLSYKLVTSTRTARNRQNAGIFHKKTDTVIHLKDSYTWSGKLTEEMLKDNKSQGAGAASLGQFASGGVANTMSYGGRHKIPRVYADGMLSVDEDEDCTFVIRYRPQRVVGKQSANATAASASTSPQRKSHQPRRQASMDTSAGGAGAGKGTNANANPTTPRSIPVPPLNDSTYNLLVLRARSKLERDLWVRAIGHEKERLARQDVPRELALREKGQCPYKRQ